MAFDLVRTSADRTDDELYEALGAALLGADLGISPSDQERFRRFAKAWFENKVGQLRQRIRDSETYRIWAETAGPGQVVDPDITAGVLRQQGEEVTVAAAIAVLLTRDEQSRSAQNYDIAVSFTRQQRDYVEQTVTAAKALGLHVFYDRDMTHQWWGENFVVEQRKVYGQRALHFVPFISTDYLTAQYPRDEFSYAMLNSVRRGDNYILPVLVGDVNVPHELLHPHIGYLRAEDHTPQDLALQMKAKVDAAKAQRQQPQDFGAAVREAHRPR
ncbi:MAG TPA: toll/interleukin-1 receptor domain-containing protein [Pseudonocardiaceae bacterium]|nr:toll/interleukin-1 receptor domain-containing protein [Pseudonocardiaceae bacterium]